MQLFYNSHITLDTNQFTFNKEESRHIVRVLRKSEDDLLYITDGKGILYTAKIVLANDKKCLVTIVDKTEKQQHRKYKLHVAIAPTKNNDRLEWFLEKATEIGIDEITPIICKNSERKIVKSERLEKIVVSAMKQSLQFHLPKLNVPMAFNDFIKQEQIGQLCIPHCEDGNKKFLKDVVSPQQNATILIGPEGDFSKEEIDLALINNYIPISLGENRLRTETAALVVTQNIAFINQ